MTQLHIFHISAGLHPKCGQSVVHFGMVWSMVSVLCPQSKADYGHGDQNYIVWISSAPWEVLESCLALEAKVAVCSAHCSATCLSSCNVQGAHLSLACSEPTLIVGETLRQWFWKQQARKKGDAERAVLSFSDKNC